MRKPTVFSWADQSKDAERNAPKPASREPQIVDAAILNEQASQLAGLLSQLPEAEADALRLRFFGELKFQEIADAMQCSLSGAKRRVRNGLTRLSEAMKQHDPSLSDQVS